MFFKVSFCSFCSFSLSASSIARLLSFVTWNNCAVSVDELWRCLTYNSLCVYFRDIVLRWTRWLTIILLDISALAFILIVVYAL